MEVVSGKLRETKGEVALHLSVIVLIATVLMAAAMQVHHVYAVVDRVTDKTNEAVLSVAAANVAGVFPGVRESDWLARQHVSASFWVHLVSTGEVMDALQLSLSATEAGDTGLTAESFSMTGIRTRYNNAEGGHLNFITTMTIEIPLSFGQPLLPPVQYDLEVHTTYEPKF